MKYKYTVVADAINTAGRYTKRPIIEIAVSHGGPARKFLALIDSGADQITMPAAIAEAFAIDRSACPRRPMMGISMERIEGFVGHLDLHVEGMPAISRAPVIFIDTDVPVLLGQEAFFDRYRIKFEKDHDTFEVAPVRQR